MKRIFGAILAALIVVPATAQMEPAVPDEDSFDYRVEITATYKNLKGTADFQVSNAAQANHVQGGDKPFETKRPDGSVSVDYLKWGFLANILAVASPTKAGLATAQLQVELSGPVESAGGRETQTWQVQTEVLVKEGQTVVVAREAGKVELRLTRVK